MRPKQHWLVCHHVRTQKRPGDCLVGIWTVNIVSILGGTYGSREREISFNDVKRGDDSLQADLYWLVR